MNDFLHPQDQRVQTPVLGGGAGVPVIDAKKDLETISEI